MLQLIIICISVFSFFTISLQFRFSLPWRPDGEKNYNHMYDKQTIHGGSLVKPGTHLTSNLDSILGTPIGSCQRGDSAVGLPSAKAIHYCQSLTIWCSLQTYLPRWSFKLEYSLPDQCAETRKLSLRISRGSEQEPFKIRIKDFGRCRVGWSMISVPK